mgnify:CR=1 FL=1
MTAANPQQPKPDLDSQETREWMDALSAVIEKAGPERAHFLLEELLEEARQHSIDMPFSANTGYVNTIEPEAEERSPGNLELEGRLRRGYTVRSRSVSTSPTSSRAESRRSASPSRLPTSAACRSPSAPGRSWRRG